MIAKYIPIGGLALALASMPAAAQHNHQHGAKGASKHATPYAGQQTREIKSLSEDDIRQLRAGAGWGFAKPAELSGYPGPRHVLDMARELGLSHHQRVRIEAIFENMSAKARKAGQAFLKAERELTKAFVDQTVTEQYLATLTREAGRRRAEVRLAHLAAHIATRPLLNSHQLKLYEKLRGYRGHAGHGAKPSP